MFPSFNPVSGNNKPLNLNFAQLPRPGAENGFYSSIINGNQRLSANLSGISLPQLSSQQYLPLLKSLPNAKSLAPIQFISIPSNFDTPKTFSSVKEVQIAVDKIPPQELIGILQKQNVVVAGDLREDGFHPFTFNVGGAQLFEVYSSTEQGQQTHAKQGVENVHYKEYNLGELVEKLPKNTGIVVDTRSDSSFILDPENIKNLSDFKSIGDKSSGKPA